MRTNDKYEDRRFSMTCDVCGQKFLEEEVDELKQAIIDFMNQLDEDYFEKMLSNPVIKRVMDEDYEKCKRTIQETK